MNVGILRRKCCETSTRCKDHDRLPLFHSIHYQGEEEELLELESLQQKLLDVGPVVFYPSVIDFQPDIKQFVIKIHDRSPRVTPSNPMPPLSRTSLRTGRFFTTSYCCPESSVQKSRHCGFLRSSYLPRPRVSFMYSYMMSHAGERARLRFRLHSGLMVYTFMCEKPLALRPQLHQKFACFASRLSHGASS